MAHTDKPGLSRRGLLSAIATVLGLALAFMAWWFPRSPDTPDGPHPTTSTTSTSSTPVADGLARTPWLGAELYQDGQRVLFATRPRSGDEVHPVLTAGVRSGSFELRFPAQPQDAAVQLTAWTDDSIFDLTDGEPIEQTPFGPGKGFADTTAGSGELFVDDEGNNYVAGDRFGRGPDGERTFYVTKLAKDGAFMVAPWGTISMVLLQSTTPPDTLDLTDAEFLELTFR